MAPHRDIASDQPNCRRLGSKFLWLGCNDPIFYCGKEMAESRVMLGRADEAAKLSFKPYPHMLRHACGFALANKGHDTRALQAWLGHKNIHHTVRYSELSPTRFKDFWRS